MTDTNTTILEVSGLHVSFGDFMAIKDLSFSLEEGKVLAVVGESGSGKSLTALALMKLLPKNAAIKGKIVYNIGRGEEIVVDKLNEKEAKYIRGKVASMVFQEPMSALNPVMKVGKQLKESILSHQSISKTEAKKIAIDWFRKVKLPEPEKMYDRYPHQLSGGQKQRVMIAMAMCHHPAVLIADEPTTALDVTIQKEIILLMQELGSEFNTSMIFITHDLSLAATIADDVLVMYRGEIMEYGTAHKVLQNPEHPYTKALLACKPTGKQKGLRLPMVSDFWNAENTDIPATKPKQAEEPIIIQEEALLKVQNLKVWFTTETNLLSKPTAYYKAVNDVSFELKKGEVLGLVGESGCGKSTLSRSLMGLIPITEGHAWYDGKDLAHMNDDDWMTVRRKMQMIFQDPFSSLNPRLTVGEIISEPLRVHKLAARADVSKEAKKLLDVVLLATGAYDKYPHEFSGGQRQRIGIARALALKPELLICDESVSALDVSIQAQMLNLLKDLQREFGLSYLFISHDLNVVHYLCDRIIVMQKGEFVEMNEANLLFEAPQNDYTRRLIDSVL